MTTLAIEVLQDADALARAETDWWDLWRRSPEASPFQAPAWLLPWWEVFQPGELRTVAVRDGGRLVALAPLYREDGPYGRRLLPLGIGLSDLSDWLIDPACPDAAGAALAALLAFDDWDVLSLEDLRPGAAALAFASPSGLSERVEAQSACPVLALPGPGGTLGDALPAGKLRKLRMARNRSARRSGFAVEAVGTEAVDAFLDELFDLHGSRWATRGESGVLSDAQVRRFHAVSASRMAAQGLARMYRMRIEGTIVGAFYGLADAGSVYAYLGGFDPAFAFESPGTVLIGHAIEAAIGEGARAFDFLRGQEPYKYEWGAQDRWSQRRTLLREPAYA